MDYKNTLETKAHAYRKEVQSARDEAQRLQEKVRTLERSWQNYLNQTLEAMCNELVTRNDPSAILIKEERVIIHYVEGGELQNALTSMPEFLRTEHEAKTMKAYQQAKKKAPQGELIVCSYLDQREGIEGKQTLFLTLPVRTSNKYKKGSLEEAIYEHNINIIDIGMKLAPYNKEVDHNGYVSLEIDVKQDQLPNIVRDLTLKLEKDLPLTLTKANVKYGVLTLREIPGKPYETQEDLPRLPPVQPTQIFYSNEEAIQKVQEEMSSLGLKIPRKHVYYTIVNQLRRKDKTKGLFSGVKRGGKYFVDANSFDRFLQEYVYQPTEGRRRHYVLVPRPQEITDLIEDELSDEVAARWLDVSKQTVERLIRTGKLITAHSGYITGESFKKLFKGILRKGGPIKTHLIEKQGVNERGIPVQQEMSMRDAAETLNVVPNTAYKMLRRGYLQSSQPGFVTRASVEEILKTFRRGGGQNKTIWLPPK